VVLRGDGCVATRFARRRCRCRTADNHGALAVCPALAIVTAHATLGAFALFLVMVAASLDMARAASAALCTARATALSAAMLLLQPFRHLGFQLLQLFHLLLHGLEVSLGLAARLLGLFVLLLGLFRVLFGLFLVASGTPGKTRTKLIRKSSPTPRATCQPMSTAPLTFCRIFSIFHSDNRIPHQFWNAKFRTRTSHED
jgi:hypothetical protein